MTKPASNAPEPQTAGPTFAKPQPRLRIRLRPGAEREVRSGHPWVYKDAINDQNREGSGGEFAILYDREDKFLAVGLYDPESPIAVRILHCGKPVSIDLAFFSKRLADAVHLRKSIMETNGTNGCRLVYGESDYLPGLVLDKYDTTLVLKLYSPAWFPQLEMLASIITELIHPVRIVLRLSRNTVSATSSQAVHVTEGVLRGAPLEGAVIFQESGLSFEADVLRGQKTGFFLDQRENRQFVASLARGCRVLNTFSFSGAFSAHAARGGATSVTDVDISAHALESSKRNHALNRHLPAISACNRAYVKADVFQWLKEATAERFDIVILDPPSLAKRQTERVRAVEAYRSLAQAGIRRVAANGILVACSCSAHVSTAEFYSILQDAVRLSGRRSEVLRTAEHPPDHAPRFKEAQYLKAMFVRLA